MRILLLVPLLTLAHITAIARNPELKELRALYYKAPCDKESADKFFVVMENMHGHPEPLMQCYKGMAMLLKAGNVINPYYKWAYFNKGKMLLEHAIKRDPQNPEIRFMRFCAQTNAPSFLNYSSNRNDDKELLLKAWAAIEDKDLKDRIKSYLLRSGYCNEREKSMLL